MFWPAQGLRCRADQTVGDLLLADVYVEVDGPKRRYYLLHTLVEEIDAKMNGQDGNAFKHAVASCRPLLRLFR